MTSKIQSHNPTLNPTNDCCLGGRGKGKVFRYIWVSKSFPITNVTLSDELLSEFKDQENQETFHFKAKF